MVEEQKDIPINLYTENKQEGGILSLSSQNIAPAYTMDFYNTQDYTKEPIGQLTWSSGELIFKGKADESAKVLFDILKRYVDEYIAYELKKRGLKSDEDIVSCHVPDSADKEGNKDKDVQSE